MVSLLSQEMGKAGRSGGWIDLLCPQKVTNTRQIASPSLQGVMKGLAREDRIGCLVALLRDQCIKGSDQGVASKEELEEALARSVSRQKSAYK